MLREATHLHPWTFSRLNLTAPKLTCSSTDNHPTLSRMLDQVTSIASFQRTCLSPCGSAESIHTFIRCNQLLTSLLIYKRELNIKLLLKPCVFHKIFLQVPEVKACVMVSGGCLIRMTMGFFFAWPTHALHYGSHINQRRNLLCADRPQDSRISPILLWKTCSFVKMYSCKDHRCCGSSI